MSEVKVNHAFVSQIADDSNDKLVRPSNWNANLILSGGAVGQVLVRNNTLTSGASWQDKGFSYLTDKAGNILTDELGNALEGKDTIDARLLVNTGSVPLEHTTKIASYTLLVSDQVIIFNITSAAVATLPDPALNNGIAFDIINKYSSTKNVTFSRSINNDGAFALQPLEVVNIFSDGIEYLIHK